MNRISQHTIQILRLLGMLTLLLVLVTGCGSTGSQGASASEATPTPLPTPIIPEKPVYTVEVGTVVQTLEFTGRASPVLEQELFFETSGSVGDVFVARGDWVQAGDVLAELDIADLEKQLAQRLINLQTLELKQEQAQIEATEAITTAWTKVEEAQANLESASSTSVNDLSEARVTVNSAVVNLENAKLSLTIAQKSDTVSKNVRDRENEAAWYEANYGEYLVKYERGEIDQARLDLEYNNLLTAKEKLDIARAQAQLALSEAQARVTQAEESLRQARVRLVELQGQPAVSDAQAALQQAELAYEQAVAATDPESYSMKVAALELEQAQLDIQDLQDRDHQRPARRSLCWTDSVAERPIWRFDPGLQRRWCAGRPQRTGDHGRAG